MASRDDIWCLVAADEGGELAVVVAAIAFAEAGGSGDVVGDGANDSRADIGCDLEGNGPYLSRARPLATPMCVHQAG